MLTLARQDPGDIFDLYRSNYATEILTAAVAHFGVFKTLAGGPLSQEELCAAIGLAPRPGIVLTTALAAMKLIERRDGVWHATPLAADHLVAGKEHDIGGYVALMATAPGVVELVDRLKTNRPANESGPGAAFIYRDGLKSAMDNAALARHFTMALAGRARVVSPFLADKLDWSNKRKLLDIGSGSGFYAIAAVERWPQLEAIALDRPEVLRVAREMAAESSAASRISFAEADMFADPFPSGCDVMLLSNILHDWDEPECQKLVSKCAAALPPGGQLVIHDVLLSDALDGPLNMALYSAALFSLTEGRAYSEREYRSWIGAAGLHYEKTVPTLANCHAIVARR